MNANLAEHLSKTPDNLYEMLISDTPIPLPTSELNYTTPTEMKVLIDEGRITAEHLTQFKALFSSTAGLKPNPKPKPKPKKIIIVEDE